ncbi:hypothetical protein [Salipiger sp. PrR003]|uniref:hypothetical protein n=1 Tax=Salipiger sp. PrR003 TaxID=2706776 RepID=UPI0013DCC775|nr:hypothetical protein [Salipiger sp. PrR003]NDV50629.1 hypothetical protein [Salipiger sp. PrR003]
MSKSIDLRENMRAELIKQEAIISSSMTRLEELSESGADHSDSEHLTAAEASLGHAEIHLKRAQKALRSKSTTEVVMVRRHLIGVVRTMQKVAKALDSYEEEIAPSNRFGM